MGIAITDLYVGAACLCVGLAGGWYLHYRFGSTLSAIEKKVASVLGGSSTPGAKTP